METYSRSHTRSHSRTATTTSVSPSTFSGNDFKKPPLFPANSGGGGFFATAYDDVFGGAPRCATLAPRPEEYSEIFGVFRTSSSSRASSSIPVLDLPAVTDIDSTASVFDYSEVFAGFHGVDFAVPYDELFQPFDAGDGCSSDEAWTPVGTESLSDDSDPFASSEKSQCFLHEDSYQPLDSKQFNVLYHKVNSGTSLCMPNMTHVEQLNAVHGYTCVVDGTTSSREMGTERGRSVKADDIVFSMDSSSIMLQKHKRKTMSKISLDAGFKSVDDDQTSGRACAGAATMSHVNSTYASVSDINLRMESSHWSPPSKAPPVVTERKRDINRSSTGLKASNGCVSEVTVNSRLPHCFDMEVNASSSAAASAAAMKDAMEKAQAKLKAAKVLMDRKKDVLQDTARLNLKTDVNQRDNVTIVPECASGDNRVQTASERGPAKMNSFGNDRHVTTTSQSLPSNAVVEQPKIVTRNAAERKHGKKCSLPTDTVSAVEDGEWLEATMCNDFVTSDNARLVPSPPSNGGGYIAVCKLQGDDDQNSDSTAEACLPEGNRRKLKANKAVSRQEYYEKLIKVAQQVHESDICVPAETDQRLTGMPQGNHREHRAKLGCDREKNAGTIGPSHSAEKNSIEASWTEAAKGMSKNALEMEEIMKKETEACSQGWNDGKTYGPQQSRVKEFPETKEEEIRMRGSYGRVETEGRLQEIVASEENEKISSEIYEKQRKEGKRDVVKQKKENERREINGKNLKDLFDDGLGGEVLQTACGSLEKGLTKELKKEEVKRSQEALVDVLVGERLQRTCQVQESGKRNDLLQRKENGNYFEVAADRQGSEHILEDSVMLESHSKCEDAPGRVIRRQRLDECHQLAAGDKRSGQGLKQDGNEEKFERVTEQGTIEKKSMQVGEMEEAVKIKEKAGYGENVKVVSRSHSEDEEQGSGNSPEIELPTENEFVKSSGGPNLREQNAEREPDLVTPKLIKPHTEADGFLYVSAQKKNAEDVAVTSDEESRLKAAESTEGLAGEKPTDSTAAQMGAVDNEHESMVHVQDSFNSNNNKSKSGVLSSTTGLKVKNENKKVAESVADPKLVKDFNLEQGGRGRNFGEGHAPSDQEKIVKSASTEGNNGWNEYARKKETACIDAPESKEGIQKRSQLPNISQSTEWKGKIIDRNCSYEEKTKEKERNLEKERLRKLEEERERERERNLEEERLRKLEEERERERERNLEEERLRKLEEEREREREREKDRMAVEIAIREARERAYADARERAERLAFERATDESRQRAMAEARERLEKACAEARERSLADKASEARLRAERAAVERATAEARQRAIEKVMAERATFEAREQMQRSVSEKFTSERDVFMRQSSMPSMHSDKPEATDGEPAQRCKARLERHRRTVERVAKALAEKNMRDLLAQREQAERSRLAETLDADIKRWSSGKEGNLRALLSTLQYILAPDSGWQPIPLTEVITAAAVKKAYRKATLCVHPDKLQQRGASVQQKYICEKVFDLLKEAWNRFNSEEK